MDALYSSWEQIWKEMLRSGIENIWSETLLAGRRRTAGNKKRKKMQRKGHVLHIALYKYLWEDPWCQCVTLNRNLEVKKKKKREKAMRGERLVGWGTGAIPWQVTQGSAAPKAGPRYRGAFALDGDLRETPSSLISIAAFGSCVQELSRLLRCVYSFWHLLSLL